MSYIVLEKVSWNRLLGMNLMAKHLLAQDTLPGQKLKWWQSSFKRTRRIRPQIPRFTPYDRTTLVFILTPLDERYDKEGKIKCS